MPLGSTAARNAALDAWYGDDHAANIPDTWWIAIFHGDPRGSGTELTGTGGVPRAEVDNTTANFGPADSQAVFNNTTVTHGTSSGAWTDDGTWVAFMDASSGGNLWHCDRLSEPIEVPAAGYLVEWNPNDLAVYGDRL